ncbi:MAG: PAS domain S-box protein [Syntrophobacterales bacterium]|nr:MAG: PAS domain S-box protein [Syntrophobacterales bacterium]
MRGEELIQLVRHSKNDKGDGETIPIDFVSRLADLIYIEQNIKSTLKKALMLVLDVMGFGIGYIHLIDESTQRLKLYTHHGLSKEYQDEIRDIHLVESIPGKAIKGKKPLIIKNLMEIAELSGAITQKGRMMYHASFPMEFAGKILGTLSLTTDKREKLTPHKMKLLVALAQQISVAIGNRQLFDKICHAKSEWENAIDSISDLIFICDDEFRILKSNRMLFDRYGYLLENVVGRECDEIFYNEKTFPISLHDFKGMVRSGMSFAEEVESPRYDGIFSINVSPLLNMDKQLIGSIHLIKEVTETRQLEREKRDLWDRMTSIMHGLVELDERGSIQTWNRGAETLLGYPEEELKGKFLDKAILPEEHRESYEEVLTRVCADGHVVEFETEGLAKDGRTIPLSLILGAKHNHHGKVLSITGFIRDIQHRKEHEKKEIQTAKNLAMEGMVRKVGNFFGNILDDILDRLDFRTGDSGEGVRMEDLKGIEKAALKGLTMVGKLRKFANEGTEEGFDRLNTQSLFREMIALTREKWAEEIEAKGIQVEVSEDQRKLPFIHGDKDELREVFLHIISNAMESMGPGGTLTLKSRTDRQWITIAITDTGIGMKPEEKRRAFDPFYSSRGVDREGLGLTLSQWIVRKHSGEIVIKSKRDRGTTVMVKFPVSEEERLEAQ